MDTLFPMKISEKGIRNQKIFEKTYLPEKTCPVCNLPFKWRKKWARDWVNVIYCSKKCGKIGRSKLNIS